MKTAQGFTLVELMVVILIVAILAAAVSPIMRGRIESAKWSEGKSYMGTIAQAIRVHISENGNNFTHVPTLRQLGFAPGELNGCYFTGGESGTGDFSWVINDNNPIDFLITATAPDCISNPSQMTLDHNGNFTEIP